MKAVRPGDRSPRFEVSTVDGSYVRVPAGDSWTLISFLRYASCPMCNLRVRELSLSASELEAQGIKWLAVFHSPRERLEHHLGRDVLPHIMADPARSLYELYGVRRSWLGMLLTMLLPSFYWHYLRASALGHWGGAVDGSLHSMPADFLISPDGIIRLAHYGRHIGDHLSVASVIRTVQNAQVRS